MQRKPVTLAWLFRAANSAVEIRRHAKTVWLLSGDAEAVAEWALARLERGLFDPCGEIDEEGYLRDVVRIAQGHLDRELLPVRELLEPKKRQITQKSIEANERERIKERERQWAVKRQQLIERDEQRRRGPVVMRLEKALKQPAAAEFKPRRLSPAERMDRSWRRRRYLSVAS